MQIAIAHHAASGNEVKILNIIDGTATVQIQNRVDEIAYRDLTRVIVNGSVIDNFEEVSDHHGVELTRTIIHDITGSAEWAHEVYVAWSHCYR